MIGETKILAGEPEKYIQITRTTVGLSHCSQRSIEIRGKTHRAQGRSQDLDIGGARQWWSRVIHQNIEAQNMKTFSILVSTYVCLLTALLKYKLSQSRIN